MLFFLKFLFAKENKGCREKFLEQRIFKTAKFQHSRMTELHERGNTGGIR